MTIAAHAAVSQGRLCSPYSTLYPLQPWDMGDGGQHQVCLGSRAQARPIHLFRVTCCHLSPAPPAHTGAQGCPWSPPPSPGPPLTHLSGAAPVQQPPGTEIQEEAAKQSQLACPLQASRSRSSPVLTTGQLEFP